LLNLVRKRLAVRNSGIPRTKCRRAFNPEFDNPMKRNLCRPVKGLRRIPSLLLLAVWLAATQHCILEAAGLWDAHADENVHTCCSDKVPPCTHDGCEVVEGGSIVSSTPSAKVSAPSLAADLACFEVGLIKSFASTSSPAEFVVGVERPSSWVPIWHFARRAAPSPRAPSLSLA